MGLWSIEITLTRFSSPVISILVPQTTRSKNLFPYAQIVGTINVIRLGIKSVKQQSVVIPSPQT
jgi:hypothetical protein